MFDHGLVAVEAGLFIGPRSEKETDRLVMRLAERVFRKMAVSPEALMPRLLFPTT